MHVHIGARASIDLSKHHMVVQLQIVPVLAHRGAGGVCAKLDSYISTLVPEYMSLCRCTKISHFHTEVWSFRPKEQVYDKHG